MENRVIIITGPTASGKSDIAFFLAQMLDTEIISADSRQIYRQLRIGSAQPPLAYLVGRVHHFIGSHDLREPFDAGAFEKGALEIIGKLHQAGKIPIVCGGSGLYIRGLTDGIIDIGPEPAIREELHSFRQSQGDDALWERLHSVDPDAARTMLPQNYKRVMRALEVYYVTGKSILEIHREFNRESNLSFLQFGILWQREQLYDRINQRVETMIEEGLVKEVQDILAEGFPPRINGLNTVGYKEVISYLNKEIGFDEAIRLIKRNTRHYAKRQMTWFNKIGALNWLNVSDNTSPHSISEKIYWEIVN